MKVKDLTGKRIGKLTVIEFTGVKFYAGRNRRHWKVICDCGTIREYPTDALTKIKSCGCVTTERIANLNKTHGMCNTAEYKAWRGIKERCYSKNSDHYHCYGGRGIEVCKEWLNSFENFYNDMGYRPSKTHSIDRIDVNGNYCKENCRWATEEEQRNNKTTNVYVNVNNEILTLSQVAHKYNINYKTLHKKYKYDNLSIEQILKSYEKI